MPQVLTNQTTDIIVTLLAGEKMRADGRLQVDVNGVLDGADVITHLVTNPGASAQSKVLSWLAADGEIENGADWGVETINNRTLQFEIKNANALTDISLSYDTE